jgi:hypothetical protein
MTKIKKDLSIFGISEAESGELNILLKVNI